MNEEELGKYECGRVDNSSENSIVGRQEVG